MDEAGIEVVVEHNGFFRIGEGVVAVPALSMRPLSMRPGIG